MSFINNILNKAAKAVNTEDKIFTVSIDKLHFDEDYKAVFKQEEDKVQRIAEDMKANGFDKSQPIILDENYAILDGNSRFMACQIAGITKVPVIIKKFESKKEALLYALGLQVNRRNIADESILIDTYNKLAAMKDEEGNKLFTDVEIAEKLRVSPRQISKAKEVDLKATDEIKAALRAGEISLHKAYTTMKEEKKTEEMPVQEEEAQTPSEVVEETTESTPDAVIEAPFETAAIESDDTSPAVESLPKPKKPSAEKPQVEKLSLKFKPEDFALIQNAAQAANVSVAEYAMNILMKSVQTIPAAETVSEKETA
ncbi:ParB N-terminal domain-containing protein [Treponema sp.]|uniref:ParB/RepB/Spo0J family partition protein n=1 Tax=Treponema sp. TaxID=166 RepID=UPI0025805686|nr:ParB N-terminal domain-containing protein [Treponema sp.]